MATEKNPFNDNDWNDVIDAPPNAADGKSADGKAADGKASDAKAADDKQKDTTPPVDYNSFVKETFGWENVEAAKQEIQNLKTPKPPTFTNEDSKKIYETLLAGQTDPLYDYLHQQKQLAGAETMSAKDALKLHIKLTNKGYSDDDVRDVFEEKYTYPEKPIHDAEEETIEQYNAKLEKYNATVEKINRKMERDSRAAKDDFAKMKSALSLPQISPADQPADGKLSEAELNNLKKVRDNFLNKLSTDYKNFKGFDTSVKSEVAGEFPISFVIPEKELIALKDSLPEFNLDHFIDNRWFDKDNNPKIEVMMADRYLLENFGKIIQGVANESANEAVKKYIKSKGNVIVDGSGNGKPPEFADSQLQDENKKQADAIWSA